MSSEECRTSMGKVNNTGDEENKKGKFGVMLGYTLFWRHKRLLTKRLTSSFSLPKSMNKVSTRSPLMLSLIILKQSWSE